VYHGSFLARETAYSLAKRRAAIEIQPFILSLSKSERLSCFDRLSTNGDVMESGSEFLS